MLNKLCTYQAARKAGVPTPKFWITDKREQLEKLKDELIFPLIVKPFLSHQLKAIFGGVSFACVRSFNEL